MLSYKVRISCALVCPPTTTFGQLESTNFENRRILLHPTIEGTPTFNNIRVFFLHFFLFFILYYFFEYWLCTREFQRFSANSQNFSHYSTTEKIQWFYIDWNPVNYHWISETPTDSNLECVCILENRQRITGILSNLECSIFSYNSSLIEKTVKPNGKYGPWDENWHDVKLR